MESIVLGIIPKGSSKQVGVDKMLDYFGISLEESMAFGDGGNDVLMLKHVGIGEMRKMK